MTLDLPRWTPYHWWGDAWAKANPLTLDQLIESGTLELITAKALTTWVSRGESVVICAERSGAGKSTLAHALLESIPAERTIACIRGRHESFSWAAGIEERSFSLLVNEISDHLPVYLWGEALNRTAALVVSGAQLIATTHPDGLRQLIIELGQPLPRTAAPLHIVSLDDPPDAGRLVAITTASVSSADNPGLPV